MAPTTTILEWLRQHRHRTGTKEGCAEGDCGACTVVIARPEGAGLRHETVNACIRFLPMLDGCQLLTVEDVAASDGTLHPVQTALIERHGSQCGFCTPGFVMSLWSLWRQPPAPTETAILDGLAGNLCRCTGYGPIIEAARSLQGTAPASQPQKEEAIASHLRKLDDGATLDVEACGTRFVAPRTLDELATFLEAAPQATLVSGATDVGLWVTKQDRELPLLVWTGRVGELARLEVHDDHLAIGAGVSYSRAASAMGTLGDDVASLWRRIGSVPIRNAGTIGGNIANGSPIGDTPPLLIALGATLELRRGSERRRLPVEDFFLAYGRQDLRPGEFLERILVPRPAADATFKVMKISKRFDQDISALCGAFHVRLDEDGRAARVRIAFGGMAAIPKRASAVEAALLGRPWNEGSIDAAMSAFSTDFAPLTDMRASAAYRLATAKNLLRKCFLESSGEVLRLQPGAPAMAGAAPVSVPVPSVDMSDA